MKICPVEAEFFHADRKTDKHDEVFFLAILRPSTGYSFNCWNAYELHESLKEAKLPSGS